MDGGRFACNYGLLLIFHGLVASGEGLDSWWCDVGFGVIMSWIWCFECESRFLFDIFDLILHFGFIARICKTDTTAVPSFTDLSEKLGFLILDVCCFNLEVRSLQLNHGLWVTFYNDWPAIDQFYMFFQFLKFLAIVWVQLSVLLGFKELT